MIPVDTSNAVEVAKALKNGALPAPAKSLPEAVCRVMEQVGYVQKDKQMTGGGSYRYVSVEAVIDALRPEMIRQQLVLLPADLEPLSLEWFEGKNGGRQNRTQVKYIFRLMHAPSGESAPVVVIGEAIDVGDKSGNKAMTAARKYALIMAFNIETGLDPDDHPSSDQERAPVRQPVQPRQPAHRQQQQADPPMPPRPAPPPPKVADDKPRVARYAQDIAQAGDLAQLKGIGAAIKIDFDGGHLTGPGREHLGVLWKQREAELQGSAA